MILHIIGLILKIIGILLLVILGILLLVIGVLLFVPLRYELRAEFPGKLEDAEGNLKISWLLHLIAGRVEYRNGDVKWQGRIAWKKLGDVLEAEDKPTRKKEKKPEEKPSTGAVKQEDKKAAASAKAEEKKPAEDKGAEDMPESKKETEKKDQTDADGIPEDFRLNIVGEGALGSVVMLPVEKIDDFEGHPFPVQDDKDMLDLVESIKKFGVLEPVTVIRSGKDPERYEMVAGHRRKHGCALAGVAQIPAIVRDMDRDSAIIYMVDSNLKRENISPMVKARAYTMKLEAMKRKAGRPTKAQVEAGYKPMRADEQLA
mgnify:CR=1 FL=1